MPTVAERRAKVCAMRDAVIEHKDLLDAWKANSAVTVWDTMPEGYSNTDRLMQKLRDWGFNPSFKLWARQKGKACAGYAVLCYEAIVAGRVPDEPRPPLQEKGGDSRWTEIMTRVGCSTVGAPDNLDVGTWADEAKVEYVSFGIDELLSRMQKANFAKGTDRLTNGGPWQSGPYLVYIPRAAALTEDRNVHGHFLVVDFQSRIPPWLDDDAKQRFLRAASYELNLVDHEDLHLLEPQIAEAARGRRKMAQGQISGFSYGADKETIWELYYMLEEEKLMRGANIANLRWKD
eukprot:Hpha_TRINITY_DN16736_c1_g1::TRINITY_DN16736_c1_g1_i2::g.78386::m.78386